MSLLNKILGKQEEEKKSEDQLPSESPVKADENESYAAIAAAIYLYQKDIHDFENYKMTIKRIDKIYSPWSSKIYSLRRWPK